MFTQKLTACLVGLACVAIATTSCSKKQSTYSADGLPYKATLQGVVVYSNGLGGQNIIKQPMANATVYLNVSVAGTLAKTINTKTDAAGKYQFTNIPVSADWAVKSTTLAIQVATTTLGNYTYSIGTSSAIKPTGTITPDAQLFADSINMAPVTITVAP